MATYVVGLIDSKEGRKALSEAKRVSARDGAHLMVVNATRGESVVDSRHMPDTALQQVGHELTEAGVEHTLVSSVASDPGLEVLRVAEESGAELIVIGLRKRSPVGKLLLGSTAQQILLNATCNVLCVRPGPAD